MENIEEVKADQKVIDFLDPKTPQHARVLQYLLDRLNAGENEMSQHYARWRTNEMKVQAYVELNKFEENLKEMNDAGKPPSPVSIVVPFAFATIQTIVTYLYNTLGGRNPIFSVGANNADQADKAVAMEILLQHNCDAIRFLKHLNQFLLDDEVYGVGIMRQMWKTEKRRVWTTQEPSPVETDIAQTLGLAAPTPQRVSVESLFFEGNDVATIDPFLFFPDPRVPMSDVNTKGEFVFWRAFEGKHILKRKESDGVLKYVDRVTRDIPPAQSQIDTARNLRLGNNNNYNRNNAQLKNYYQVDQGVLWITPAELGIGSGRQPEMWLFTIINKEIIVQAEPVDFFHGKLPVEVCEGSSLGYSFGSLSTADYLGPLQDTMSWMINSHIYNVRAVLNNQLVVDPSKVNMDDVKNPEPGKIIRLKSTPFGGMDVRSAIMQLPMQDITRSHLNDFELFGRFGADITGASENLRGIQASGGRKTATEIRVSGEAGSSRLAAKAKLISAQALVGVAEQMACNYQQYMSAEVELQIVGTDKQTVRVSPDMINKTNFRFPIHDGTMPMDKIGLVDVWKEILTTIMTEPSGELRQAYDVGKIFEWVAKLGGAQNIDSFKIRTASPEVIDAAVQQGDMVPLHNVQLKDLVGGI